MGAGPEQGHAGAGAAAGGAGSGGHLQPGGGLQQQHGHWHDVGSGAGSWAGGASGAPTWPVSSAGERWRQPSRAVNGTFTILLLTSTFTIKNLLKDTMLHGHLSIL